MGGRIGAIGALGALLAVCLGGAVGVGAAQPVPADIQPLQVPDRTSISVRTLVPGVGWGTDNESEERAGLSISKLYIADYALRHGDGSAADKDLCERMIRKSDDYAADRLFAKYPKAIDAVAAEYGLTATHGEGDWEFSTTSTADVADFLAAKVRSDPDSPILAWMEEPAEKAADGTRQDWGTARLPQILGTKWGWADVGDPEVASASFGPGFTVSAHTYGSAEQQTQDVQAVLWGLIGELTPRRH
ncbi:serine hydrolase [Nocardia seriolae]|nr:serine hydrolase [Nocardia seriolae]APA97009.1 hypothetical protein NS506_02950 [Nocardia seriolae]MTJ65184.1 hypothetical protein [Nocardia seriolae]MTJ71282.1 hypothetical protein [Nocardia seriolae]MTJ86892.1 hypothetical protein [Nocardia seriolae]MTK30887.1 hypothetical protein [Nocardia seriolae]